jgi:putative transposase
MQTFKFKLMQSRRNRKLHRQISAAGLAWNHCVALTRRYYKLFGKSVSKFDLQKHLAKLKKRQPYGYLSEFGSQALQEVVDRLFKSYERFFDGRKKGERVGLPGFRKVRKYKSFTLKQAGWKVLDGNTIRINGQNYRYHKSRKIEGTVKTVTIKRDAVGDLWVCFACEQEQHQVIPRLGNAVGFDFGLKNFLTPSQGNPIESPRFFEQNRKELRKLNRALSRKIEGSNNWRKAKKDLARLHRRIANQRSAWFWQTAWRIVGEYAFVGLETLNIRAMQRLWGRKVGDYGFSEFVRVLEYVASKVGTEIVHIDKWYPSSQLCSACGHRYEGTKDLSVRTWTCPKCGAVHDRDRNAAANILAEALRVNQTGGASSVMARHCKTGIGRQVSLEPGILCL